MNLKEEIMATMLPKMQQSQITANSRKLGVSPILGACRWCFQMPFLFGDVLLLPNAIELRQESSCGLGFVHL